MKPLPPLSEILMKVLYEDDPDGDGMTVAELAPKLRALGGECARLSNGSVQVKLLPLERRDLIEKVASADGKRVRVSDTGVRYLRERGAAHMGTMTIKTLWGWRRGTDFPELMVAWDEYSADENYEGFNEACEKAIREWGSDLREARSIDIKVSEEGIVAAFQPTRIEGTV